MAYKFHDGLALGSRRYSNARAGLRTVDFHGVPIKIEIEAGQTKSGIGEDGREWTKTYKVPYGEIPNSRTLADGDPIDVYLGPNPLSTLIYCINQVHLDGSFDEPKCMLGFSSAGEAVHAYKSHGPTHGFGSMDIMTIDQFKHGFLAAHRKI